MAKTRTVNLTYKPTTGYCVTSTVNTLIYKPGYVLTEADVQRLISDGYTVKVSA